MASVIGTPVVLAWDVWEPAVEEWVIELRRARAKAIAVTSSQAADTLRSRLEIPVIHIPEAVNFARLAGGRDLASRPPQVVNFGRRYETWHAAAGRSLEPEIRYLVEEQRGALIARDQQSFASALATSRVSVCFTRSTTDERVAGSFHTMTQRYLESIFAGCIVLGDSPAELQELFGYDPVVNVDWADPLTQVRTLVKNAEKYQGLVDMNTKKVIEVGGWLKRAAQLSGLLAK
ncbi:aspartate/glutamate racemase family protein [Williamsia serinedens]|nr:aspartate/glutamate racemase family protein [Williamsia serinedens]